MSLRPAYRPEEAATWLRQDIVREMSECMRQATHPTAVRMHPKTWDSLYRSPALCGHDRQFKMIAGLRVTLDPSWDAPPAVE